MRRKRLPPREAIGFATAITVIGGSFAAMIALTLTAALARQALSIAINVSAVRNRGRKGK